LAAFAPASALFVAFEGLVVLYMDVFVAVEVGEAEVVGRWGGAAEGESEVHFDEWRVL
jgi:hypothetical protein